MRRGLSPGCIVLFRFIADDYGASSPVNQAIEEVCEARVVRSVTVLAADECVHPEQAARGQSAIAWGAHLYLTEYLPLTSLAGSPGRILDKRALLAGIVCGRISPGRISAEFEAQLHRLRDLGFPVSFIDTHQNVHGLPFIHQIVRRVAARCGLEHTLRPIHQLDFGLDSSARSRISALSSKLFRLPAGQRVLVNCPCYRSARDDVPTAVAQWDAMLGRISSERFSEVFVPCHPGLSPAERELYRSPEFAELFRRHTVSLA